MAAAPKSTRKSQKPATDSRARPFRPQKSYATTTKSASTVGAVPITGDAASRLLPRRSVSTFPSAPGPAVGQLANADSVVTDQRLYYFKLTRYSPLRYLTPELLGQYFDLFEQGYLRYLALLQYYIAKRDPILTSVISKRSGAIKRLKLEIIIAPNCPESKKAEAAQHKEALQYFYDNLRCTSSVDQNLLAGKSELLEQMMSALAYKWAVHELIWQPSSDGLTARFNFIPLWFFENRTGKLRFLEVDYQLDGRDLEPGSFMVTSGPGLMEPCSVSYLYKTLALKWWLRYIEGHASPLTVGVTNAPRGSTNYNAMKRSLDEIVDRILINKEEDLKRLDLSGTGELPYLPMVDEMNRMMATIWRGADLSTISGKTQDGGQGALLQGKEEHNLQCDDGERLTETLNFQVDPQVIAWTFGEGVTPLAYAKVVVPPLVDSSSETNIIDSLNKWGIKQGKRQVLEMLGRAEMPDGDEPIEAPALSAGVGPDGKPVKSQKPSSQYAAELEAANEARTRFAPEIDAALLTSARSALAASTEKALLPLADALDAVLTVPNEARPLAYQRFKHGMPELLDRINRNPANQKPLAEAMASAWFNGLLSAEVGRSSPGGK